jgi:hypothetical protein
MQHGLRFIFYIKKILPMENFRAEEEEEEEEEFEMEEIGVPRFCT